ncbi:TPA: PerC family transcriptional regulator [Escherichia coli]|uniref:PerC family transcriptional regulator n=1 Tax=Escherichia coli TaxID=562 RepID=UPI0002E23C22|nr:PerC family transcriptional regulator [Escherichia coli]EGN0942147.1 PerC family transcriptional regulator [Escherichia coli]ELQ7361533.1 PerC family transcriptional regulator [Escherichia coli]MBB7970124.1 PerC family transcriptional regulator [Escherichia coli]HBA9126325.1 PerC family transcriptional regulator [Escherichia coli]
MIKDSKAEELEARGLYRRAAARWAEVMAQVASDKERELAAKRRSECIRKAERPPIRLESYGDAREAIRRAHISMGLHSSGGEKFRAYPKG